MANMVVLQSIRESRAITRACWLALALFSFRAIVPLGYMPAALGDGGPFALCPGSSLHTNEASGAHAVFDHHASMDATGGMRSAGGMHPTAGTHPDAGDYPSSGHDERWERCELGIGAADAAIAVDVMFSTAVSVSPSDDSAVANPPNRRLVVNFRARAPPA
jgi:hypothetical protein